MFRWLGFNFAAAPALAGWTWSYPAVQSNTVYSMWITGDNQLITVGDLGAVTLWDNGVGRVLPAPTRQTLRAVWGTSLDYFIVAGDNGVVLLWNGQIWQGISSPSSTNWRSLWGASPTCVFVGSDSGIIGRWDGSGALICESVSNAYIYALSGLSSADVYAAAGFPGLLHWDGAAWSSVDTGLGYGFDVWAMPSGEVLVLGDGDGMTILQGRVGAWTPLFNEDFASPLRFGGTAVDNLLIEGVVSGYGAAGGNIPPPPRPFNVGFAWDGSELRQVSWRWADSCNALSKREGASPIIGGGVRGVLGQWDGTSRNIIESNEGDC